MLIAVAFIGIIGLLISVWIIRQLIKAAKRKFRRFIINLAKRLEPEGINNTRSKIGSNLADIRKNIQSSETDAVRQKLENTYLKDKVKELETAKAALLEELSGSDYTSFEFDLWQQVIETIDFLVNERMRLLGLVDAAVSFSGDSNNSPNLEKLVKEINDLRLSREKLTANLTRLSSDNQKLAQKFAKADGERKELLDTVCQRQNTLAVQKKEVETLRSSLTAKSNEFDRVQEELSELKFSVESKNESYLRLLNEKRCLSAIVQSQTKEIDELKTKIKFGNAASNTQRSSGGLGTICKGRKFADADFLFTESYYALRDILDRQEYAMDHQEELDDWD